MEAGLPKTDRTLRMTWLVAYTDASCRSPDSAWGYLIVKGVATEDLDTKDPAKIGEFVGQGHGLLENATNNQGEVTAILRALIRLKRELPAHKMDHCVIVADSLYAINGLTIWRTAWERRKFVGVKNLQFWHPLWDVFDQMSEKYCISTLHVRGHQGIVGNEYADSLSRSMFSLFPKAERNKLKANLWTTE